MGPPNSSSYLRRRVFPTLATLFLGTCPANRDQTPGPNAKGEILHVHGFPRSILSPIPCSSFLRSHSQPKPRRNLRSRYADMMESIGSRSSRSVSSSSGSLTTRQTRSSSIASPSSFTNPSTTCQYSDHGRLGTGFSILKPEVPRNQTLQVPSPKILALPPWLQDTITELGASHPLRAVFPTLHDGSDPDVVESPLENSSDHPMPRRAHPDDSNWSFGFPSTPPRIPPSRPLKLDSDASVSSGEPQQISTHYPLYHKSLLHLRPGSPTPSVGALTQLESPFAAAANSYPSSSTSVRAANTTHISEFKTTLCSPSLSLTHDPSGPVSPAPRNNAERDSVFRYNPSQDDSATPIPPSPPFVFERPVRVYFDSPIEDPISSDPSELDGNDPFKLDPEECKNLSFKWAPFDLRTGTGG